MWAAGLSSPGGPSVSSLQPPCVSRHPLRVTLPVRSAPALHFGTVRANCSRTHDCSSSSIACQTSRPCDI
jgi:hypothetical protein